MIKLRPLVDKDLELILAWRNNPLCYAGYYEQTELIEWNTHYKWWHNQKMRIAWIVQFNAGGTRVRDIGYVSVHRCDTTCPEIDITIGEVSFWGQGAGYNAVLAVMEILKEAGYEKASAKIIDSNERSVRLFTSLGFERAKLMKVGQWLYTREL